MFDIFRKLLGSKRIAISTTDTIDELRCKLEKSEKNRAQWRGQANVDATENIALKSRLKAIRDLLGKDDETFSRYTRDQIEDMSIEEFRQAEPEIDQDIQDGKLFLQ
jgi:hypothetical protein